MPRVDTLTAYICRFSYLLRNNPIKERLDEEIKSGKKPDYSFSDFIRDYSAYAANSVNGVNTERSIMLCGEDVTYSLLGELSRWQIVPKAGKHGRPVTVIKPTTGKRYDFNSDSVAVFKHYVFAYEFGSSLILIFHRQSGSGCKSVFLETANSMLRSKGLKLEMNLVIPLVQNETNAIPKRLVLQFTRDNASTDAADNMKSNNKKVVVQELSLNLSVNDNQKFLNLFDNIKLGSITKEAAFATIVSSVEGGERYNEVAVDLKIGKRTCRVKLDEIERILGVYDITVQLASYNSNTNEYVTRLLKLADSYCQEIITSERG